MIDVGDDGDIANLHSLEIYPRSRTPNKLGIPDTAAAAGFPVALSGNFHLTVRPDVCSMHS
jgi:hypothetical protein